MGAETKNTIDIGSLDRINVLNEVVKLAKAEIYNRSTPLNQLVQDLRTNYAALTPDQLRTKAEIGRTHLLRLDEAIEQIELVLKQYNEAVKK